MWLIASVLSVSSKAHLAQDTRPNQGTITNQAPHQQQANNPAPENITQDDVYQPLNHNHETNQGEPEELFGSVQETPQGAPQQELYGLFFLPQDATNQDSGNTELESSHDTPQEAKSAPSNETFYAPTEEREHDSLYVNNEPLEQELEPEQLTEELEKGVFGSQDTVQEKREEHEEHIPQQTVQEKVVEVDEDFATIQITQEKDNVSGSLNPTQNVDPNSLAWIRQPRQLDLVGGAQQRGISYSQPDLNQRPLIPNQGPQQGFGPPGQNQGQGAYNPTGQGQGPQGFQGGPLLQTQGPQQGHQLPAQGPRPQGGYRPNAPNAIQNLQQPAQQGFYGQQEGPTQPNLQQEGKSGYAQKVGKILSVVLQYR